MTEEAWERYYATGELPLTQRAYRAVQSRWLDVRNAAGRSLHSWLLSTEHTYLGDPGTVIENTIERQLLAYAQEIGPRCIPSQQPSTLAEAADVLRRHACEVEESSEEDGETLLFLLDQVAGDQALARAARYFGVVRPRLKLEMERVQGEVAFVERAPTQRSGEVPFVEVDIRTTATEAEKARHHHLAKRERMLSQRYYGIVAQLSDRMWT